MRLNVIIESMKKYKEKFDKIPNELICSEKDANELKKELEKLDLPTVYDEIKKYKDIDYILGIMWMDLIIKPVDGYLLAYKERNDGHLTLKDFKKALSEYPDNTKVYIERIEDFYFNENGWKTEHFEWDDMQQTEGIRAYDFAFQDGKLIILAHY